MTDNAQHRKVLKLINDSMEDRHYPPSRAEIAIGLGLRSRSRAQAVVDDMVAKGLIEVDAGVPRGIRVKGVAHTESM